MIDLTGFSDLVPSSGRLSSNATYIKVSDTQCKLVLGADICKETVGHFGSTVSAKASKDLSVLVLTRGNDRRISASGRDVSLLALRDRLKAMYGDDVSRIFLGCSWDEDERGSKVLVLRMDGRKEYRADATVRKLKG